MDTNTITCEHGLRRRTVVCEPCRVKRREQQPTREELRARVRALEAGLAWYADEDNYLGHCPEALDDRGARARAALAENGGDAG